MTQKNNGSLLAEFALLAGIYLMLRGIVDMIAYSRGPGKLAGAGVVGALLCYVFALCLHVTGEGDPAPCIAAGHMFGSVYVVVLFFVVFDRIFRTVTRLVSSKDKS